MFLKRSTYVRTISARRIQAFVRMFLKRRNYIKEKSATMIQFAYRKYRLKKYISQLLDVFGKVLDDPHLGKRSEWPQPPRVLQQASVYFKKIHERWRAKTMIKRLSKEDNTFVKRKIRLMDIFHGKKPWAPAHKCEGNHLEKVHGQNPKYQSFLAALNKKHGDNTKIIFSCQASRLTSKGKVMERDFVVTEKGAYQAEVGKGSEKGLLFLVDDVESIEVSSFGDKWVVVKSKVAGNDCVIQLGSNEGDELCTEFFLWMSEHLGHKKNAEWNHISFKQSINFNNTKKGGVSETVHFKEAPKDNPKVRANSLVKDKNAKNNFTIFY